MTEIVYVAFFVGMLTGMVAALLLVRKIPQDVNVLLHIQPIPPPPPQEDADSSEAWKGGAN